MLQSEQKRARTNWIRRIVLLLRVAEVWQLREIYYIVAGYIGASKGRDPAKGREGGSGTREMVQ